MSHHLPRVLKTVRFPLLCAKRDAGDRDIRVEHIILSLTRSCLLQPSVRKQHNAGFKHKANVRAYYLQFEQQETEDMLEKKMAANMAIAMQPSFGQPAVLPGTPALPLAGLVRPPMAGMPVNMPPGGAMPPMAGLRPPPHGGCIPVPMPGPPSVPFTCPFSVQYAHFSNYSPEVSNTARQTCVVSRRNSSS